MNRLLRNYTLGSGFVVAVSLLIWAVLLWCGSAALAQGVGPNPVTTIPYTGANTSNASSTVAVTNTFQSVFVAPSGNQRRVSCLVQNNSAANPMYVFFGPVASATIGSSIKLAVGSSASCVAGGIVLQDQVSVTGTSGDAFFAAQQ